MKRRIGTGRKPIPQIPKYGRTMSLKTLILSLVFRHAHWLDTSKHVNTKNSFRNVVFMFCSPHLSKRSLAQLFVIRNNKKYPYYVGTDTSFLCTYFP